MAAPIQHCRPRIPAVGESIFAISLSQNAPFIGHSVAADANSPRLGPDAVDPAQSQAARAAVVVVVVVTRRPSVVVVVVVLGEVDVGAPDLIAVLRRL